MGPFRCVVHEFPDELHPDDRLLERYPPLPQVPDDLAHVLHRLSRVVFLQDDVEHVLLGLFRDRRPVPPHGLEAAYLECAFFGEQRILLLRPVGAHLGRDEDARGIIALEVHLHQPRQVLVDALDEMERPFPRLPIKGEEDGIGVRVEHGESGLLRLGDDLADVVPAERGRALRALKRIPSRGREAEIAVEGVRHQLEGALPRIEEDALLPRLLLHELLDPHPSRDDVPDERGDESLALLAEPVGLLSRYPLGRVLAARALQRAGADVVAADDGGVQAEVVEDRDVPVQAWLWLEDESPLKGLRPALHDVPLPWLVGRDLVEPGRLADEVPLHHLRESHPADVIRRQADDLDQLGQRGQHPHGQLVGEVGVVHAVLAEPAQAVVGVPVAGKLVEIDLDLLLAEELPRHRVEGVRLRLQRAAHHPLDEPEDVDVHHPDDLAFLVVHSPHPRLRVVRADVKPDAVLFRPCLDVRQVEPVGIIAGEDVRPVRLHGLLELLEHGRLALREFDVVKRGLELPPQEHLPVILPLQGNHEDGVPLRVDGLVGRRVGLDVHRQDARVLVAVLGVLDYP